MDAPEKIVVTGGTGFVGQYVLEEISKRWSDTEVWCLSHRVPDKTEGSVIYKTLDITDADSVEKLIREIEPNVIIHLAAQANVPKSFENPAFTWQVNVEGSRHLLEACVKYCPNASVLIVGSADMYGASFATGRRISERDLLQPLNPYAVSKCAVDLLAYQISQVSSLHVIRVRAFNHIGVGQSSNYAIPSFAKQIVAIERGLQSPLLQVGDLNVERDITDVRDMVKAYVDLIDFRSTIESGEAFNIGSGVSRFMKDLLDAMLLKAKTPITVEVDESILRSSDIKRVACDNSKIFEITGWKSDISIERSLDDILEWWRTS